MRSPPINAAERSYPLGSGSRSSRTQRLRAIGRAVRTIMGQGCLLRQVPPVLVPAANTGAGGCRAIRCNLP